MEWFHLSANRAAAAITVLGGLAAFIAGCAQVLPGAWPNYALAASGLLVKAVTALKFMDGSQKWDALTVRSTAARSTASQGALLQTALTQAGVQNPSAWVSSTQVPDDPPPLNEAPIPPPGEPS